ncbi:MATE family efflux transporter [Campylobacter concisus]
MDLLKDPLNKLIISLSLPAGVGMMFNTLYNVTGTFFAAKISTIAVAGMAMSFLLYLSVVGIGLGFGSALTALIGNSLGANKPKMAKIYCGKWHRFCASFCHIYGALWLLASTKFTSHFRC